jgi:hypothetical protein
MNTNNTGTMYDVTETLKIGDILSTQTGKNVIKIIATEAPEMITIDDVDFDQEIFGLTREQAKAGRVMARRCTYQRGRMSDAQTIARETEAADAMDAADDAQATKDEEKESMTHIYQHDLTRFGGKSKQAAQYISDMLRIWYRLPNLFIHNGILADEDYQSDAYCLIPYADRIRPIKTHYKDGIMVIEVNGHFDRERADAANAKFTRMIAGMK